MPMNTIPCWSQRNIRFDFSFVDDPHTGKAKFIYVRKTVRDASIDMSLKFRWEEGIKRYELPGFVDDIKARITTALKKSKCNYNLDSRKRITR